MSEPKRIPVGKNCEIVETTPEERGTARLAPSYLKNEISERLGCDYYEFDDGERGLKERVCDFVRDKTGDLLEHPMMNGVVKYFAKWRFDEYRLKRKGEMVNMGISPSPARVLEELQKCVSPEKKGK